MKLTDQELRKLRNAYNVQKKTQARRKPDRNGHRIQVTMTFEEWLQVWTDSGKLHLRGNGRGKFCMARKDDLGDYAVGNVDIKACEENSREAKLGRPAAACTRRPRHAASEPASGDTPARQSCSDDTPPSRRLTTAPGQGVVGAAAL